MYPIVEANQITNTIVIGSNPTFPNKSAIINNAIFYFNVQLSMPKGSEQHKKLSFAVKESLNMHRVPSYDWLIKVVSRILQVADYSSFKQMLMLAVAVRAKMKEQNLTQIDSLDEVFGC